MRAGNLWRSSTPTSFRDQDFLLKTLPHFARDPRIGMVQTRWEHLNSDYSLLTRTQAMALDGHFVIEQAVRNKVGFFINFNGTGGIWRKECIVDAGNWQADTLTEDLDLSYRAQLRGWTFMYLNDVTSPAELPSEINALKSQQFRWTKGAIETARKMLPYRLEVPAPAEDQDPCDIPSDQQPRLPVYCAGGRAERAARVYQARRRARRTYFTFMSVFVFAFIGSFLFYLFSQKDVYADWRKRIFLFPVFMAGSMGLCGEQQSRRASKDSSNGRANSSGRQSTRIQVEKGFLASTRRMFR